MNRKNMMKIITFAFFIFVSITGYSQSLDSLSNPFDYQIQFHSYVEESKVPLNRPVILHLEISWLGKLNRYQIEPVSQPILTNLLLEGSGSENRLLTLEDGSLKAIKAITYRLRPLEMGMAYIDGLVVKYQDQESGEEEKLSSQRIMVEIIEPLPEKDGRKLKAVIYIILFILFFMVTGYFLLIYFRKKRITSKGVPAIVSPAESYLNRLAQEVDPRGTNLDQMIQRLSKLFKEYLEQDFNIPAREQSTQEIVQSLQTIEIDEQDKINLSSLFEKLDVIKFAKKNIEPTDFIYLYGIIENFLLKRKKLFETTLSAAKEVK